jgi:hypothetical protein
MFNIQVGDERQRDKESPHMLHIQYCTHAYLHRLRRQCVLGPADVGHAEEVHGACTVGTSGRSVVCVCAAAGNSVRSASAHTSTISLVLVLSLSRDSYFSSLYTQGQRRERTLPDVFSVRLAHRKCKVRKWQRCCFIEKPQSTLTCAY